MSDIEALFRRAKNFKNPALPRALDWGLSFAFAYKRLLFGFAAISAVLEIIFACVARLHALNGQDDFLVFIGTMAVNAWMLLSVFLSCAAVLRKEEPFFWGVCTAAIRHLPKVLLSYIALQLIVLSAALGDPLLFVIPLLPLLLFLIWAPIFCAGEVLADQKRASRAAELDDEKESLFDYEREESERPREVKLFTGKTLLELGFVRSAQFTGRHPLLTIEVVILFWFSNLAPVALIGLLTPLHAGLVSLALWVIIVALVEVLVIGAAVGAFLVLLPPAALEELELSRAVDSAPDAGRRKLRPVRLQDKKWVFVVLTLISLLSTYLVADRFRKERLVPDSISVDVEAAERKEDKIEIILRLTDFSHSFRWFDAERFAGVYSAAELPKENGRVPIEELSAVLTKVPTVSDVFKRPVKAALYRSDDSPVMRDEFEQFEGSLKVVLVFTVPADKAQGWFTLLYAPLFGGSKPLYEMRYGD